MTDGSVDRAAEIRLATLRGILSDWIDEQRAAVDIRDGSPTVFYLVSPDESTGVIDTSKGGVVEMLGVVTGAVSHSLLNIDSLEFVVITPGEDTADETWTVSSDAAEGYVQGDLSEEAYLDELRKTRRDVQIDDPPTPNAQG